MMKKSWSLTWRCSGLAIVLCLVDVDLGVSLNSNTMTDEVRGGAAFSYIWRDASYAFFACCILQGSARAVRDSSNTPSASQNRCKVVQVDQSYSCSWGKVPASCMW